MNAHLVLDLAYLHVVSTRQVARCVEVELGYEEDAETLGAGGCPGGASEHEVDDIFGEVVVPA